MMAELVAEKLQSVKGQCTVAFQLYDNNFFVTRTEEGGLVPAVRNESNGRYHVHGEAVMVPKEMQYSTLLLSKPILDVAKSQQKIPCQDTSIVAAAQRRITQPTSRRRTTSPTWRMLSLLAA